MGITKNVLAVVIGAFIAMITITLLVQYVVTVKFPLPPGTDMYVDSSAAKAMAALPQAAFQWLLATYALGSFIGGIVTTIISKRDRVNPPLVVGFILMLGQLLQARILHMPLWFAIASIFTYMPFTFLGYLVAKKRSKNVR